MNPVTPLPLIAENCRACCTRIERMSVTLGRTSILSNVNLHLHCGQLAAVVGPNGGGKTTLLRAILGEVPYSGTIRNNRSDQKKSKCPFIIGYVPQRLPFDQHSPGTVLDLFAAALSYRPIWLGHSARIKKMADNALAIVNAAHLLNNRIGTLSGGQLQRVLLALALTPLPDLLLLDEPVSGVDPAGIDLFYRMVSDLRTRHHLAIVLVSHDLAAVSRYADRMLFLNRSILCDGNPGHVLASDVVIKTFGTIALSESGHTSTSAEPACAYPPELNV